MRFAFTKMHGLGNDFVVIDAPPNLGTLTWMALGAPDLVIIPVQTEPHDAMSVSMILDTIRRVQR